MTGHRLLEGVPGDYGRTQLRLSPEPLYKFRVAALHYVRLLRHEPPRCGIP